MCLEGLGEDRCIKEEKKGQHHGTKSANFASGFRSQFSVSEVSDSDSDWDNNASTVIKLQTRLLPKGQKHCLFIY